MGKSEILMVKIPSKLPKILKDNHGRPISKTYIFWGKDIIITFLDELGNPTNSPTLTTHWEVVIRDILPCLIQNFSLPRFDYTKPDIVRVMVDMLIPVNFDESKYHDIMLIPNKEEKRIIRMKKLEKLLYN